MKGIKITVKDLGTCHTWTDWGLILTEKPDVQFPVVKTNYVDLTGGNGQIDLTESLTGDVKYKNRTGSFVFTKIGDRENWNNLKSRIANFLHGRKVEIILDEDLSFYYAGRLSINDWKSDKKTGQLTLDYDLDPYKYELTTANENWEWDTLNFEVGVIREWNEIPVVHGKDLELVGSRKPIVPTITVESSDGTGLVLSGRYGKNPFKTFRLADGTYKNLNFVIYEGLNTWESWSDGTITIEYRGVSL